MSKKKHFSITPRCLISLRLYIMIIAGRGHEKVGVFKFVLLWYFPLYYVNSRNATYFITVYRYIRMSYTFPKYILHRFKDSACLSNQRVTGQMTLQIHAQNSKMCNVNCVDIRNLYACISWTTVFY